MPVDTQPDTVDQSADGIASTLPTAGRLIEVANWEPGRSFAKQRPSHDGGPPIFADGMSKARTGRIVGIQHNGRGGTGSEMEAPSDHCLSLPRKHVPGRPFLFRPLSHTRILLLTSPGPVQGSFRFDQTPDENLLYLPRYLAPGSALYQRIHTSWSESLNGRILVR